MSKRGPFQSLVVLGESTVQGGAWLARWDERWADVMHKQLEIAQESPIRYYNAGRAATVISRRSTGYDASSKPCAADRLDAEVIAHAPDLLVIAYGLNDMRAGMPVGDFIEELRTIVRRVRAVLDPHLVLVNVYHTLAYPFYPPFNRADATTHRAYNHALRALAQELGATYADVWAAQGQADHVLHQDLVHANKVGNMLIANKVFEAVVQAAPGICDRMRERDGATDWAKYCQQWQTRGVEPDQSQPGAYHIRMPE